VPLDATGALDATTPARVAPEYEIGPGALTKAAHDAGEMFIDSDVIGALDALDTALGADIPVDIRTAGERLRTTIGNVQDLVAEVGARQIRLDVAQGTQSVVGQGLREHRSTLIDTSLSEAITELAALQSSYQASLLATSRLLETSLVNFLR
jgi:flagellin-like hook-associated protein FlgL